MLLLLGIYHLVFMVMIIYNIIGIFFISIFPDRDYVVYAESSPKECDPDLPKIPSKPELPVYRMEEVSKHTNK